MTRTFSASCDNNVRFRYLAYSRFFISVTPQLRHGESLERLTNKLMDSGLIKSLEKEECGCNVRWITEITAEPSEQNGLET